MSTPRPHVVVVDGVPMSGLVAEAPDPRAVVVAFHGGASSPAYFDCPGHPRLSLLRAGAALGFTVVALDRPGYGASAPYTDVMALPEQRAKFVYSAVDKIIGAGSPSGIFLVAHSAGCELAVRMAADDRGDDLLGIALSGTGLQYDEDARNILDPAMLSRSTTGVRDLLWRPAHSYPPEVWNGIKKRPRPSYEDEMVSNWAQDFPALAGRVRVPVQFGVAEYERVWKSGPEDLAQIAALFTTSPRFVIHHQIGAGHSISLSVSAAAYHMTVLSFVEECVVARQHADAETDLAAG